MVKSILLLIFCSLAMNVMAQNIEINTNHNPNEPSIMMNYKNPAKLIAASNLNNYFISNDTGRTWTSHLLSSPLGVYGDPTIIVDTSGHFYYFHLSNPPSGNWIDRIVCQKTTDHGTTWSSGSYAGLNGIKAQDKQWSCVDRRNNNLYLTWTQFDKYNSQSPLHYSNIMFSKSTDSGLSWSDAKQINKISGDCVDSDNTVEGAVPAVGPNGEIYVAWAGPNGIVFNKSNDQGETWLDEETKIDPMPTGWDYNIPGIMRGNGLPITSCDLSNSPHRGTIYVNWSDQRNGSNDTDIWLVKSKDGGQTWSAPIRVNDDAPGKHQFFTWMAIDQTSGFLYFVFYDRRNYDDTHTDVYMAISKDGGNTFTNFRISETPFVPDDRIFFGDYTNIVAHNGIVRPIWTRLHNGVLSVWTDITPIDKLVSLFEVDSTHSEMNFKNYPNPASEVSYVSFKLKKDTKVRLDLINLEGQTLKTLIDDQTRGYGTYIETIQLSSLGVSSGTYLLKLTLDGFTKTEQQVVIK